MRPPRLERGTPGLEVPCSIQVSYGRLVYACLDLSRLMKSERRELVQATANHAATQVSQAPANGNRHFTTRPGEPRDEVNVPNTSFVSVSRTVSTIVVPVTDPAYAAG